MYIRFSQDNRFRRSVKKSYFLKILAQLDVMIRIECPHMKLTMYVCESVESYEESHNTFFTGTRDLRQRYSMETFTHLNIWDSALRVEACWTSTKKNTVTMIALSADRTSEPHRLCFYAQAAGPTFDQHLKDIFAQSTVWYSIGNGFPLRTKVRSDIHRMHANRFAKNARYAQLPK